MKFQKILYTTLLSQLMLTSSLFPSAELYKHNMFRVTTDAQLVKEKNPFPKAAYSSSVFSQQKKIFFLGAQEANNAATNLSHESESLTNMIERFRA